MTTLDVMTFNVRQMDGDDGQQSWEYRKQTLLEAIELHQPALLGTQETWEEQSRYILDSIPIYRAFGRGRFGDTRDKHNKVFYDARRLTLLESGDLGISKTPEIPGSSDWDIPSPRMITWGRLRLDGSTEVMVMNTHFPYGRADLARTEAARLVLERVAALPPALPIVVMGDFSAPVGEEIYKSLTSVLHDAWVDAESKRGPEGTFHGFGRAAAEWRVDWILCRHARVIAAETVTYKAGGLYPSDHYSVSARLEFGVSGE